MAWKAVAERRAPDARVEQLRVDRRSASVHAGRAAGEDHRGGLRARWSRTEVFRGNDLRVDLGFPYPAGDELGVLRPEVDDEDSWPLHLLTVLAPPGTSPTSRAARWRHPPASRSNPPPA